MLVYGFQPMTRVYINFDLRIQAENDGYLVTVEAPSTCKGKTYSFKLPYTPDDIEKLRRRINSFAPDTRREGGSHRPDSGLAADVKAFGKKIYDAMFGGEVGECVLQAIDRTRREQTQDEGGGYRFRLWLDEVPELWSVPWEFLYCTRYGRPLCRSEFTPFVRWIGDGPPAGELLVNKLPLRMLVLATDAGGQSLQVQDELNELCTTLKPLVTAGIAAVKVLEGRQATFNKWKQAWDEERYHVLHIIAHGGYDTSNKMGYLTLSTGAGSRKYLGDQIGEVLTNRPPKLAVLNFCEGAFAGDQNPMTGVAQWLARLGIPAVTAMQFSVTDHSALLFSEAFYRALARGRPVEVAVEKARGRIWSGFDEANGNTNEVEWATPVLFMRTDDGRVLDPAVVADIKIPDSERGAPRPALPVARPLGPDVPLDPASPFYIERPGEPEALELVRRGGGVTLIVSAPGKSGKRTLIKRLECAAVEAGKRVCRYDFSTDAPHPIGMENLCKALCRRLARDFLQCDRVTAGAMVKDYFADVYPEDINDECTRFIRETVLQPAQTGGMLVFLNTDELLRTPVRNQFFPLLQAWEKTERFGSSAPEVWAKLDIVLESAVDPPNFTDREAPVPFNAGHVVKLEDFDRQQVGQLHTLYGSPLTPGQLDAIWAKLGGHPYLTRRILFDIAERRIPGDMMFAEWAAEDGPLGDYWQSLCGPLNAAVDATFKPCGPAPGLYSAICDVLANGRVSDLQEAIRLCVIGVIKRPSFYGVEMRCRLYGDFFESHPLCSNRPPCT